MRKLKFLCCQKGQMFVETALVLPVVLVVALIAINLFKFADMCSKFDRVAADQIIAHGISSSHSVNEDAPENLAQRIRTALNCDDNCDIVVSLEGESEGIENMVSVFPKYQVTLKYKPWPHALRLPLVSLESPLCLTHTTSIVVSPYKSGVVI